MLNAQEQKVVDLLGEAWNAYLDLVRGEIMPHRRSNVKDDDSDDFRKAIHDGQRIVFTKSVLREQRSGPFIIPHVPPEDRENIIRYNEPNDFTKFIKLISEQSGEFNDISKWEDFVESEWFDKYGERLPDVDWKELLGNYLYEPERNSVEFTLVKWGWIKIG